MTACGALAAAAGAALVVGACDGERTLALDLATTEAGEYRGFQCVELEAESAMWLRGFEMETGIVQFNLVIDFVALGGVPDCRSTQVSDWCASHDCAPLLEYRQCIPIEFDAEAKGNFSESMAAELERRSGEIILDNAPDEAVLVRAIGTTDSCDTMATTAAPTCDSLIGCMSSCPVVLDQQDGDLVLDLDVSGTNCEAEVAACASADLQPDASCPG